MMAPSVIEQSGTPVDRGKLEVLGLDECRELMASVPVARVAFIEAGEPVILPVNHLVDWPYIAFRTTYGAKLGAAANEQVAAMEADAYDVHNRSGWSVLVRGRLELVPDDVIDRLLAANHEVYADGVKRDVWVRIVPTEISGRRVPAHGPRL